MPVQSVDIEVRGLHFAARSCGEGPLVLVQHGFPDLPASFEPLLEALARAGYRAVAPTLRGYARGCTPALEDAHVLEASFDLEATVTALGETRAALVGHDWGALASYLCLGRRQNPFTAGVTMAIPNLAGLLRALPRVPRQLQRSWYQAFFALPGLPERWFGAHPERVVRWAYRTWSPGFRLPEAHIAAVARALADDAVRDAALEYYRALLRPGPRQSALLKALRSPAVPTLCLFGERDGCMDARLYEPAAPSSPHFVTEKLAGVGHFLHMEAPDEVQRRVIGFLRVHHPPRA